jgi:hypothetical protein
MSEPAFTTATPSTGSALPFRLLEATGHEHSLSRGSGRGDAIEFAASPL